MNQSLTKKISKTLAEPDELDGNHWGNSAHIIHTIHIQFQENNQVIKMHSGPNEGRETNWNWDVRERERLKTGYLYAVSSLLSICFVPSQSSLSVSSLCTLNLGLFNSLFHWSRGLVCFTCIDWGRPIGHEEE